MFGFYHTPIRGEGAADKCAANLRWLRRLSGPPGRHTFWVAGPQPCSGAAERDIVNWACDADDSCLMGHDQLMLLLSRTFRSKHEMRQHDCRDPDLAKVVCSIEKLVPIWRMLPACTHLQTLCLDYYCGTRDYVHGFDTRALVARLPHLETLILVGWGETNLAGLPPSLRTLIVRGFGFAASDDGPVVGRPRAYAIPEGCRLDSAAVVGYRTKYWGWDPEESSMDYAWQLDLASMWRSCRELLVDAEVLSLDGTCFGVPTVTHNPLPVLEALRKALGGASPLHRLVIDPDAHWAWDRRQRGASEDDHAAGGAGQDEAAEEEDEEGSLWGRILLYRAARLADLPAETLRQYGLAVRTLAPTRPQDHYGRRFGYKDCSHLSELLAGASRLPGRYDQVYQFNALLEITPADG